MDKNLMQRDDAVTLALQVLGWIAAQDELFEAFLSGSGLRIEEVRAKAADPGFLGAVLDFLLSDDSHVLAFSAASGLSPHRALAARMALPGGRQRHWT